MTKHLVYKTTNLVNGKYYIGVHSCNCKNCRYLGSGTALKAAIRKYGRHKFKRKTLKQFSTRELAFEYESQIVNKSDSMSYNCANGGQGFDSGSKAQPVNILGRNFNSIHQASVELGLCFSACKKILHGNPRNYILRENKPIRILNTGR